MDLSCRAHMRNRLCGESAAKCIFAKMSHNGGQDVTLFINGFCLSKKGFPGKYNHSLMTSKSVLSLCTTMQTQLTDC